MQGASQPCMVNHAFRCDMQQLQKEPPCALYCERIRVALCTATICNARHTKNGVPSFKRSGAHCPQTLPPLAPTTNLDTFQ